MARVTRTGTLLAVLGVVVACGGEEAKVRDLAHAVLRGGSPPTHASLPPPHRRDALGLAPLPDAGGPEGPMRELIALGQEAVPALVEQLDDGRFAPIAAYALAEIGGDEAAHAVWKRYETLLPKVERRLVYQTVDDGRGRKRTIKLGERTVGADGALLGELEYALAAIGGPVATDMVEALRVAIAEAERLAAAGEPLMREETRIVEGGVQRLERWSVLPVQTAGRLLRVLGFLGDARAVPAFDAALRSPVPGLRFDALDAAGWLADRGLLGALATLLDSDDWWSRSDDIRLRHAAAATILELLGESAGGALPPGGESGEALVARCRVRLQEVADGPR